MSQVGNSIKISEAMSSADVVCCFLQAMQTVASTFEVKLDKSSLVSYPLEFFSKTLLKLDQYDELLQNKVLSCTLDC